MWVTRPRRCLLAVVIGLAMTLVSTPASVPARAAPEQPPAGTQVSSERTLRLDSIEIYGNTHIKDATVLSYIQLSPGDPVDAAILESARRRLLDTDHFNRVELSTRPGQLRGAVVLILELDERSRLSFETGFGYHDLNGWFLTLLGMRIDNPLGIESRLRVGLRVGFRLSGIDAEWETPTSLSRRFGVVLKVEAYNNNHLFFGSGPGAPQAWAGRDWRRFDQDIGRVAGEIGVHYQVNQQTRATLGFRGQVSEPDSSFMDRGNDIDYRFDDLPGSLRSDLGKIVVNGVFLRLLRDSRDINVYPASGSFLSLTMQANTDVLGSDRSFVKAGVDLRKYLAFGERKTLSGRVKSGYITDNPPYYERFYLGGNYSIRGFEEYSLSPTDGDDAYWFANLEMRVPLTHRGHPAPWLTGLLFVDVGQGWRRADSFSVDDVKSAVGYGVRVKLPWLGTLGIDAGVPLTSASTDDRFRVHALLGFSF